MTTSEIEQIKNTELPKVPKLPESKNTGAVFGNDGMPPQVIALDKATSPVRSELETLRGLQGLNPTEKRERDIIDLERQRGRSARYALLQKGATPEQKEILKEKDALEKLKASDILLLKKKGVDLSNLLLVPVGVDPTKSTNRDFIEKGEHKNFIVNFGESRNINHIIGAGDILPPTVNRIKVNGVEGERKYSPRPGYYDIKTGKYLAIYDGDKLEVVAVIDKNKMDEKVLAMANEAEDKWLRERRIEDMIDNGGKALSELSEDKELVAKAQEEMRLRKEAGVDLSPDNTVDNGENLQGQALWENEKFQSKLTQVCQNLGVSKDHMKIIMMAESGLNPKVVNRISGATGLIQFMPKTALGLHTSVGSLRKMPSYEQLDYVEKYFLPYKGKLNSPRDLYLATFYPAAIGKPDDFVMGSESARGASPETIARQNWIIAPGRSVITVADFNDYVDRKSSRMG